MLEELPFLLSANFQDGREREVRLKRLVGGLKGVDDNNDACIKLL